MAEPQELGENELEPALESERWRAMTQSLYDILDVINSGKGLSEVLAFITTKAAEVLSSDAAAIYRRRSQDRVFHVETIHGDGADILPKEQAAPGENAMVDAAAERTPIVITDLRLVIADEEAGGFSLSQREAFSRLAERYRAMLAVPIIVRGEPFGALCLYWRQPEKLTQQKVERAAAFGAQVSLAIENVRLLREFRQEVLVEERRRLATRLHDSLTQTLYSLAAYAQVGREQCAAGDRQSAVSTWRQVAHIAGQALKETRLLIYEMRPPVLEREGLVNALRTRLAAVEERSAIEGRVLVHGAFELPDHLERELYWVAQEALNNTLRHADATAVTVNLRISDQLVELEIQDDGKGFDPEAVADHPGMGLDTMREGVEALGGTFTLLTAPGKGTTVRARIEGSQYARGS